MRDEKRDELNRLVGAIDLLSMLREDMEQWLEEASKQEALENVVGHLGAIEEEYRHRHAALQEAVAKI